MANLTTKAGGNLTLILDPELCTLQTCDLSLAHLNYLPTAVGNSIFIGVFAILLPIHVYLGVQHKTWGFLIAMVLGLGVEAVGYASRILMHDDPFTKINFILYLILLTIAPAFLSAGIYLCLSRIIVLYAPSLSRFKPGTYTILFCSSDLVSLILQAVGGAIASTASNHDDVDIGTYIMIAGLIFQVVSLVGFVALCLDFAWRLHSNRQEWDPQHAHIYSSREFKAFLSCLSIATITILIRCVFRAVELADGFEGELANDELLYMIFEPPMIAIAALALTIGHPGSGFQGSWEAANFKFSSKDRGTKLYHKELSEAGSVYTTRGAQDIELRVLA